MRIQHKRPASNNHNNLTTHAFISLLGLIFVGAAHDWGTEFLLAVGSVRHDDDDDAIFFFLECGFLSYTPMIDSCIGEKARLLDYYSLL